MTWGRIVRDGLNFLLTNRFMSAVSVVTLQAEMAQIFSLVSWEASSNMDYVKREKLILVLATIIMEGDLLDADLTCPVCKTSSTLWRKLRISYAFNALPW
jgi:hypothetical protein